ncbi:MAG: RluA family pseudouridine synthase [Lachnospiraceae bacterium]|nr:RluA family pseudouridine synthase [Lachnospiraceae bacterium]
MMKCMRTQIIYEDQQLLVIYKPVGLAAESAGIAQMDVVSELKLYLSHGGKSSWLGLIHRLDQPVEGLLAVAKDPQTASALSSQLRAGRMRKSYRAVLYLPPGIRPEPGVVTKLTDFMGKEGGRAKIEAAPISGDVSGTAGRRASGRKASEMKEAILTYRILEHHENTALAGIELETGRFHQIRCQMAFHGMPLLGDQKYGTAESMEAGRNMGIKNVALCADSLKLIHPKTGKELCFAIEPQNVAFREFAVSDVKAQMH